MHRTLSQYPSVFLHTGDCFVGVKPTVVSTVLGSCVAVTLFHRTRALGCICHAFLPDSRDCCGPGDPQVCRYVDTALVSMFATMERLGVKSSALEIKVFGGAAGYARGMEVDSAFNIGPKNVEAVMAGLTARGVTPAAQDVGGSKGRKLFFLTSTGEVWIRRLGQMDPESQRHAAQTSRAQMAAMEMAARGKR